MLPNITGVSELQRNSKKALAPIRTDKNQIVILTDRQDVFGVIMNIEHYKELISLAIQQENDFWQGAFASSLDFWNDKSNDVYEKCL